MMKLWARKIEIPEAGGAHGFEVVTADNGLPLEKCFRNPRWALGYLQIPPYRFEYEHWIVSLFQILKDHYTCHVNDGLLPVSAYFDPLRHCFCFGCCRNTYTGVWEQSPKVVPADELLGVPLPGRLIKLEQYGIDLTAFRPHTVAD